MSRWRMAMTYDDDDDDDDDDDNNNNWSQVIWQKAA